MFFGSYPGFLVEGEGLVFASQEQGTFKFKFLFVLIWGM